jgi:hypothetical protein
MDRRAFLAASLTVASSLRWLRAGGLFDDKPIASAQAIGAAGESAGAVFGAIAEAVLPGDDARFTLAPASVAANAGKLFALDNDAALQRNLVLFDDLPTFATPPDSLGLAELELVLYPPEPNEKSASPIAARLSADARAYQALSAHWPAGTSSFTQLSLADRRAYMMLWAHSALGLRRRFYRSVKTLVMAAAYSMDAAWPAIGYAGPLLHERAP